jgi:hypothetical protein
MELDEFKNKLQTNPETIEFEDTITVIEENYHFLPTAFKNDSLENAAGENSGSCKLFRFAQLQGLTVKQTLACFGRFYRDDVLKNPGADNHQNIRNFMKTGWQGISFEGEPLIEKTGN